MDELTIKKLKELEAKEQEIPPDEIFKIGAGVNRPLRLQLLDIIAVSKQRYPDLDKRAGFIKF